MKREIFDRCIYRFNTARSEPLIIDCGANIGLAVLYWKQLYPAARIEAFEPDPIIFRVLENNTAGLNSVTLHATAVWRDASILPFRVEGSWGGRLCVSGDEASSEVPATRLRDLLDESVDMLKLDIEGAEYDVLLDCFDRLHNVANLFVEYHSFVNMPQILPELLNILTSSGFRYFIVGNNNRSHPLTFHAPSSDGMDLQLDIFAYRAE
jgi:FkbM family methyltransferase